MNYLSDICSLCVEHNQNLTNIALKDIDGIIIEEKLKCFILELANFKPNIPKYMCNKCMENLNHAYKFRLKCLKNIPILNEYLQTRLANESKHKTTDMTREGKSRTIEELEQTKSLDTIVIKKEIEEILETPATIDERDQEIALENVIVKSEFTEEIHAKKDNAINTNKTTSPENVKTEVNEELSKSVDHIPFEYVEITESRDIQKLQLLSEEGNTESFSKNITNNNAASTSTKPQPTVKQYQCNMCEKVFISQSKFQAHKHNRKHSKRSHKCPICDKSFIHLSKLKRHSIVHTDIRPFQCEICNKTFNDAGNLTTHKRIHNNDRPYECSECDRSFRQNSALITHMRTHTGEKPYHCHLCQFKCASSSYLVYHMKSHSGVKEHVCKLCQQPFNTQVSLKRHMQLRHKKKRLNV